jgi:protoporphyrinogen oxidase
VADAVFRRGNHTTLINEFRYPRLGPGMMWERCRDVVEERGGRVCLETDVVRLPRRGPRITAVVARRHGADRHLPVEHVISSMPIVELVEQLDPPPPAPVLAAARSLTYRAFVLVGLVLEGDRLFPDQWLYVHAPEVRVGRIQNYNNWSRAMVPPAGGTALGMEYFCDEGDEVWSMSDAELVRLATRELAALGLAGADRVSRGLVIRQPKAYPVYDGRYREHLAVLRTFLSTLENLQTIGRNGMHRYNNQDHSMLTGLLAARNLCGGRHDLWNVNTERSYYEEMAAPAAAAAP